MTLGYKDHKRYGYIENEPVTVMFKPTIILRIKHKVSEEEYELELERYKRQLIGYNVILLKYNDADVVEVTMPPHSQTINSQRKVVSQRYL